jgi:hypothetical protein
MIRLPKFGRYLTIDNAGPQRTGKRRARSGRQQSSLRYPLRLEQLESRVTPSILGTFDLDGNATTGVLGSSGSTTTSHDWDWVFADAGSPATSGTFVHGPTSAVLGHGRRRRGGAGLRAGRLVGRSAHGNRAAEAAAVPEPQHLTKL